MDARAAVIAEALEWLGTPHRNMARSKGAGVDCGLFLAEVYERCGVMPHVEPEPYPPDWHLHHSEERYLELVELHAHPVPAPQPGDIALFRYGRCISHGAIVLDWPQVIHAVVRQGVVIEDALANVDLVQRLAGFWSPWSES